MTGDFSGAVVVAPGAYDIVYEANPGQCADPQARLPCVGGIIQRGVSIDAEGILDLDLPTARLSGAVTLSGAEAPAGPRGTLRFISDDGPVSDLPPLPTSGPAQYVVRLVRGGYDIVYVSAGGCDGQSVRDYPCLDGRLPTRAEADVDGTLDLDVPAVELTGSVTIDGSAMPVAPGERGTLSARPAGLDPETPGAVGGGPIRTFGAQGDATFSTTLVAGRYNLDFDANPALCTGDAVPGVPCSGGSILEDVALEQSGSLTLDVRTVELSGRIERDDGPLPDTALPRGEVRFELQTGGTPAVVDLGATGDVTYRLRLMAGRYELGYLPTADHCSEGDDPLMPCMGGPLLGDVLLEQSASLDVPVPVVRLQGSVLLPVDDDTPIGPMRGAVAFARDGGSSDAGWWFHPLPPTGSIGYGVALLPGRYDIAYAPDAVACLDDPDQVLPCAVHPSGRDVEISADGVYDLPLVTTRLGIELRVNGEPIEDAQAHGQVRVAPVPVGFGHERPLQQVGAGNYALRLLPGAYRFEHVPDADRCGQLGSELGSVPCTSQVLLGCD